MSERMTVVRWMPPLSAAIPNGGVRTTVRMKEWVLPTEAVERIHQNGITTALLGLVNSLVIDGVLEGNALLSAQDYLRCKAHEVEAGRIVKSDIK